MTKEQKKTFEKVEIPLKSFIQFLHDENDVNLSLLSTVSKQEWRKKNDKIQKKKAKESKSKEHATKKEDERKKEEMKDKQMNLDAKFQVEQEQKDHDREARAKVKEDEA